MIRGWSSLNDDLRYAIDLSRFDLVIGTEQIQVILDKEIDINGIDDDGKTVMDWAISWETTGSIQQMLRDAGAKTVSELEDEIRLKAREKLKENPAGRGNWTILNDELIAAIDLSHFQPDRAKAQISDILEEGVDINAKNSQQQTVLDYAYYDIAPLSITKMLEAGGAKKASEVLSSRPVPTLIKERMRQKSVTDTPTSQIENEVKIETKEREEEEHGDSWNQQHDELLKAMELSKREMRLAKQQIKDLIDQGLNMNVRDANQKSLVEIAKDRKIPYSIILLLMKAGTK